MKRFLLTTTALVAAAGASSAAEMNIGGRALVGVYDQDGTDETGARFFQDVDVTFSGIGRTDGGVAFGFSVDLDEIGGGATGDNDDDGGVAVFLSGGFGNLSLGDTDGALDWALVDSGGIFSPGSLNDDETSHAGYNGSHLDGQYDGQVLRYEYSFRNIGIAFSAEFDDDTEASGGIAPNDGHNGDDLLSAGLRYAIALPNGSIDIGIGRQFGEDFTNPSTNDPNHVRPRFYGVYDLPEDIYYEVTATGMSAVYTSRSGFAIGGEHTTFSVAREKVTHYGLGGGVVLGPLAIHANYGAWERGRDQATGYGLAAGYFMGRGATFNVGYSNSDPAEADSEERASYSMGFVLSF